MYWNTINCNILLLVQIKTIHTNRVCIDEVFTEDTKGLGVIKPERYSGEKTGWMSYKSESSSRVKGCNLALTHKIQTLPLQWWDQNWQWLMWERTLESQWAAWRKYHPVSNCYKKKTNFMYGIIRKETENKTTNTITPLKMLHFKKDIMELGKVQKKSNQKDWGWNS